MDISGETLQRNGGFFTRREALAFGENDRGLRVAVRDGHLVRLRHGVYALAADHLTLEPEARHLVRARAALASQGGEVALTGPSAAILRGYAVWGHDLSYVHLLRLGPSAARRQAGVVHHVQRSGAPLCVKAVEGVLAVGPAEAAWETARISGLEGAVVTLDSALHSDAALLAPLQELAARHASHPGSRTARFALRLARSKSESPGESLVRVACFRHGIPEPELQFEVVDSHGLYLGRSDFYWPKHRHLAEFDGMVKYGRLLKPGQTAGAAIVDEKTREDAMRGTGRGMTRMIWPEVQPSKASRTMADLAVALDRSHRLYTGWS